MLLKFCKHIPFINTLMHYNADLHKIASKKFIFLWVISICPILFAAVLIASQADSAWYVALWDEVRMGLFATDQFIYTVSFLPPVLYLLFEKYELRGAFIAAKRRKHDSGLDIPGFLSIYCATILTLIFAAVFYGFVKADSFPLPSLFVTISATVVYFYAMLCWYITLLDSATIAASDFVHDNRQREEHMKNEFSKRLHTRSTAP